MARNQEQVICQPGVWTELTNSAATSITFQVLSGSVKVRATTGTAPSSLGDAGYVFHARPADAQEEDSVFRLQLSSMSSTVGADRVFATPINRRRAVLIVDHA